MEELLTSLQAAIQDPVEAGLANMWDLCQTLWLALIAGIFGLRMLFVATGHGGQGAVQGCIGSILTVVLGKTILEHLPDLAQFSVGTSGEIAGAFGSTIATPVAIAGFGLDMFNRALDHGASRAGFLGLEFWEWGSALAIVVTGLIILLAYLWLALISLSAFLELFLSLAVNAPLAAFLGTPGFGSAAVHPISNLMSATIRLSGIGVIASLGAVVVQSHIIPEGGASLSLHDCMVAEAAAIGIAFLAWQASKILSHVMLGGGVGWNGAAAAWSGMTAMASTVMGGGGRAASALGMGGGGGGTSGGGGFGGGGSSPGPVPRRSRPVNAST